MRNVTGCNMSMRRSVFDVVGTFDERIGRIGQVPLGCDETELCIRLGQTIPGARVVFEPSALVHHRVTEARTTWRYLRSRSYAEGLSKALIARLIGASDATAVESRYLVQALTPRAGRASSCAACAAGPRGLDRGGRDRGGGRDHQPGLPARPAADGSRPHRRGSLGPGRHVTTHVPARALPWPRSSARVRRLPAWPSASRSRPRATRSSSRRSCATWRAAVCWQAVAATTGSTVTSSRSPSPRRCRRCSPPASIAWRCGRSRF